MAFADLVATVDHATRDHLGGVAVVYTPTVGSPAPHAVTVTGLFDANFVLLLAAEGDAGVEQRGPAVFLRTAELPSNPDDDDPIITIDGQDYAVRERQRDGLGGIRLLLHLRS